MPVSQQLIMEDISAEESIISYFGTQKFGENLRSEPPFRLGSFSLIDLGFLGSLKMTHAIDI